MLRRLSDLRGLVTFRGVAGLESVTRNLLLVADDGSSAVIARVLARLLLPLDVEVFVTGVEVAPPADVSLLPIALAELGERARAADFAQVSNGSALGA